MRNRFRMVNRIRRVISLNAVSRLTVNHIDIKCINRMLIHNDIISLGLVFGINRSVYISILIIIIRRISLSMCVMLLLLVLCLAVLVLLVVIVFVILVLLGLISSLCV